MDIYDMGFIWIKDNIEQKEVFDSEEEEIEFKKIYFPDGYNDDYSDADFFEFFNEWSKKYYVFYDYNNFTDINVSLYRFDEKKFERLLCEKYSHLVNEKTMNDYLAEKI